MNAIQLRAGKVHAVAEGFESRPACGGNRGAEGYRKVAKAINCANCLKKMAAPVAEAEAAPVAEAEAAPVETPTAEADVYMDTMRDAFAKGMVYADAVEVALSAARDTTTYGNPDVTGQDVPASATVTTSANDGATSEGENMADTLTHDVTTEAGQAAVEQIQANIERAKVLATEDNTEALEELGKETETIISALSGKGSIKAKKEYRDAWKAAIAEAERPRAEVKKVTTGTVVEKTWDQFEGVKELVTLGAEKMAEGVRLNLKTSNVAKEVAAVTFDMWTRIPNKDGLPDIKGDSDPAKKASGEMLRLAGQGFEKNYDTEQSLKRLTRSVQDQRTDVRAAWLRSLDEDTPEAAERRALVAKVLEGKPEDVKASEWVADKYGVSTLGVTEKKRLAYQEKKKALEAAANGAEGGAEGEAEEGSEGGAESPEGTTPDERVMKLTEKLIKDLTAAKPEDFEKASDETKEAIREKLEKARLALKEMIAATL